MRVHTSNTALDNYIKYDVNQTLFPARKVILPELLLFDSATIILLSSHQASSKLLVFHGNKKVYRLPVPTPTI